MSDGSDDDDSDDGEGGMYIQCVQKKRDQRFFVISSALSRISPRSLHICIDVTYSVQPPGLAPGAIPGYGHIFYKTRGIPVKFCTLQFLV